MQTGDVCKETETLRESLVSWLVYRSQDFDSQKPMRKGMHGESDRECNLFKSVYVERYLKKKKIEQDEERGRKNKTKNKSPHC